MAIDKTLLRRIVRDPCDRMAIAKNFQAIAPLLEEIIDTVEPPGDPGDPPTDPTSTGVIPVKFRVKNKTDNRRAEAVVLDYDGSNYVEGAEIIVNDWTANNAYACNLKQDHEGWAHINTDRNNEYDIINLDGLARFVEGTLNAQFDNTTNKAMVTVNEHWGGYPNKFDPGTEIEVHDRLKIRHTLLTTGDKVLALFDDTADVCEFILVNHVDKTQTSVVECLVKALDPNATAGIQKCDTIQPNAKGVYDGFTKQLDPAATNLAGGGDFLDDNTSIWVVDVRQCETTPRLKHEECYVACKIADVFNGAETGTDERPLYAVRGIRNESESKVVRWGKALANWYRGNRETELEREMDGFKFSPLCPFAIVSEIRDCENRNGIAVDDQNKNAVKVPSGINVGTVGYLVFLWTQQGDPNDLRFRDHPNVEIDNLLHFEEDLEGNFVNHDSGDGMIFDVKMQARYAGRPIRQGWNIMDHSEDNSNRVTFGGSGVSMNVNCGLFPKFGYQLGSPESPFATGSDQAAKDGGERWIPPDVLDHKHEVGDTLKCDIYSAAQIQQIIQGLIAFCDDPNSPNDIECQVDYDDGGTGDGFPQPECLAFTRLPICTGQPGASFINDASDSENVGAFMEDCQNEKITFLHSPPQEYQDAQGNVDCSRTWGPLPTIPPYRNFAFYERVDNSEDRKVLGRPNTYAITPAAP